MQTTRASVILSILGVGLLAAGFWAREQMIKADLGGVSAEEALSPVLSKYQSADLYDPGKQEQIKHEMQELREQLEAEETRWRIGMSILFTAGAITSVPAIWTIFRAMRHGSRLALAMVFAAACAWPFGVTAQDQGVEKLFRDVAVDQLPKGVKAAVKRKFPDAKISSATENFRALDSRGWGLTIQNGKQEIDMGVTEISGSFMITRIAKPMEIKDLPKPVLVALQEKYPKATIKSAKDVLSGNIEQTKRPTKYELSIETAAKERLLIDFEPTATVGANGESQWHPEKMRINWEAPISGTKD